MAAAVTIAPHNASTFGPDFIGMSDGIADAAGGGNGSGSVAGPSSSNGDAGSAATENGSGSTLFNADEAQFMNDSLTSADSFDPFTIGAPGFKVPNVLPAHLGGMGAHPGQAGQNQQGLASDQLPRVSDPGSMMDGLASSSKGGYGQDSTWQQQQLDALRAGRSRYLSHQGGSSSNGQFSSLMATTQSLPDVGSIGQSLQDSQYQPSPQHYQHARVGLNGPYPYQHTHGSPYGPPGMGAPQRHPSLPYPPSYMMPSHPAMYPPGPGDHHRGAAAGPHLANLALQFPSSHAFPHDDPTKRQRTATHQSMDSEGSDGRRGRSPSTRPPWTVPPDMARMQSGGMTTEEASLRSRKGPAAKVQSSATAALAGTMEADAPYVFESAPRPPPSQIDLGKAAEAGFVPAELKAAYFGEDIERLQPHLHILRQEQLRRKALGFSANIRKSNKQMDAREKSGGEGGDTAAAVDSDDDDEGGDGKDKKKQPHALLTEAEKKANHIASEQKRRANIRKGYEMLSELVPALRDEPTGGDGDDGGSADDDDDDDDDDDAADEDNDAKRGKKRVLDGKSGSGTAGADAKGSARSEATILMHAVEHIRAQLQEHRDLLVRRQEAQRRIAAQHDVDVTANPADASSNIAAPGGNKGSAAATRKKTGGATAVGSSDKSKR